MMYLTKKLIDYEPKKWRVFTLRLQTYVNDNGIITGYFRPCVTGFIRWRNCGRPYIFFPNASQSFGFAPGKSVVFDSVAAIFKLDTTIVLDDVIQVYDKMGVRPYAVK